MLNELSIDLPKFYAEVNNHFPLDYSDFQKMVIEWSPTENYQIIRKIGRGKFSEVFQGINLVRGEYCAVKVLKPVRLEKIKREIKILQNLSGGPNIVRLLDVCMDEKVLMPSLVFEYLENRNFRVLYNELDDLGVRRYLFKLLTAIDYTHRHGIIHRDVKPNNIMYEKETDRLLLIDWGLADFYFPGKTFNVHVSTRYFKPPELLLDYRHYHYSLDMWSFGCVMAGIIFRKEPFLRGKNNKDQIERIVQLVGNKEFKDYVRKYHIKFPKHLVKIAEKSQKVSFSSFVSDKNLHLVSHEAIDLIKNILMMDHNLRITAKEALKHPYFDPVRNKPSQRIWDDL